MEVTAETLLNGNINWQPYAGQNLSLKDFVHIFKIKASDYFKIITAKGVLSPEEQAKAARFLQQQSRENYTVRKYFLRKLLAHFTGLHTAELAFHLKANKKPGIDGLFFNVSHSKDLITIAFSASDIGIDLEYIDPYFQYKEVMDMCFSKHEIQMVEKAVLPILAFYLIWTRKEAIVKATGEGIITQLQEVPGAITQALRKGINYQLSSHFATESHLISIANPLGSKPELFWNLSPGTTFF